METAAYEGIPLIVHPSMHNGAGRRIFAHAGLGPCDRLEFRYALEGDLSGVRIAELKGPQRAQGLWNHTCFEAFIKAPGATGYYELNFSPSGDWALFQFSAYREGLSCPDVVEPAPIIVRRFADRLEVEASIGLRDLADLMGAPRLQIALSAVVEEVDGTLSHWALRHPQGKADFHDPAGFAIELAVGRPSVKCEP